ncbi:MAG: hypothetical protein K0R51_1933 [Cytophagaceae bacterium]|jgi:hypothetical protein|nr:hypothetical protein [Cytophagaceae bacterium]
MNSLEHLPAFKNSPDIKKKLIEYSIAKHLKKVTSS